MRLSWTFWDILGHFKTFRDNFEYFGTSFEHLDCFPSHFQPFSPIIGIFYRSCYGPTEQRTDTPSYRDAWTHLKMIMWLFFLFLDHFYQSPFLSIGMKTVCGKLSNISFKSSMSDLLSAIMLPPVLI